MSNPNGPKVSFPGEGLVANAFGRNVVRLDGTTGNSISVIGVEVSVGDGSPMHVHTREEETFRVLSGVFGFWCGEEYLELSQEGIVSLRNSVPHRLKNIGTCDGELMVIFSPGGFERSLEEAAHNPEADPVTLGARYGVTFVAG